MAAQTDRGIPLSALCPKFLHTNSTSHTWPFSAVAELIDNAYDPDVKARQFWIDKTIIKGEDCLIFMDNGAGMEYDKMHKMLSFGFSDKQTINGHVPVGLYGNGFKSGSMRLGKDAIVFSKKAGTMCVGMLSQTYLQKIGAENVIVPIVRFKSVGQTICPEPEHVASLQDILRHSLFQTEDELHSELKAIDNCSASSTGTRIIIWSLRKTPLNTSEFDFEHDRYDIRIPAEVYESTKEQNKRLECGIQSAPESTCSLRAYCSILYLKPRMQIIIRGQKVKTQLISKSLAHIVKDSYKPQFLSKHISITFGYNTKSKEQYGIMMYHKNRLIKAYERVGCQLKANSIGVGVIGVIVCDFLQPTHNKQDFDSTDEYRKTMYNVGVKLEEYWKEVRHRLKSTVPVEDIVKRPDQNWAQCDGCLKWRKLPDGIDTDKLPDKWFCHLNPDPQFRSCTAEEEREDSDDEQPRYQKTYKQHERNKRLQQEKNRQQLEEEKKRTEEKKILALKEQNAALMRKQQALEHQLRFSAPSSPKSPAQATPSSSRNASPSTRAGSRPSDNMPIISNVISLSTTPTRIKRGLGPCRENVVKKPRMRNGLCSNTPDSPSTRTASPQACSSPTINDEGKEVPKNDENDDIVILESCSTPRPNPSTFDLSKVKSERRSSLDMQTHMEHNDSIAMETSVAMENPTATTSSTHTKHVNITTQTEQIRAVKEEVEDSRGKKESEKSKRGERDEKVSEIEQGLSTLERINNQEPEEIESMQVSLSAQSKSVTSESNKSESKCVTTEQMLVKSEGEPDGGELSTEPEVEAGEKSATLKDPYLIPLDRDHLSVLEAQQQQDKLLELLEVASRERDESRTRAQLLTSQVEELQSSLLEITEKTLKKEQCQQGTQTSVAEEEQDYKALYLQAKEETMQLQRELDQLKRERAEYEAQAEVAKKAEAQSGVENRAQSKEGVARSGMFDNVDDELACQMDLLLRELDDRNKEREELKKKLDRLEDEKNTLLTCCENLRKDIKKESEEAEVSVEERGAQTEFPNPPPEESEAGSAGSSNPRRVSTCGTNQNETQERPKREPGQEDTDTLTCRLRELRQRVGRLLVTFVPALDLEQVNYDCEVIDEILGQVIDEISCPKAAIS
ncbi:MORC family CW-type zinc finger protein 3a [Colossoma macropomum]|uniref:MORC family CW-type zinc finger protein 3a n=1 Tax=Colossoma macropomum TaxID=42526 RepID=UPI00186447EB|nr:MORC family CW-type zinc finger protein 3a [Colossoma macropomum]